MKITRDMSGFSLIELLVAVGILALISSVVLANHSRFNSSVLLGSLAYDIALSVREAQVFGLSVRQYSTGFQVGYGVRFSGAGSYEFFVDTNGNKKYDDGVDSIVKTYTLGQGHRIQKYCGTNTVGAETCTDSDIPLTHLDIVFFRPEPDAVMSSNLVTPQAPYSSARVIVSSPNGDERSVEIASTGQISVKNP